MKRLFAAFAIFLASKCVVAAEEKQSDATFRVHGRLALYNGTPSFRVWIIGTKRILGVAEVGLETPMMPAKLFDLACGENLVFGDFTVVPLTQDEPGVMRIVRIVSAEHLVITDGRLNVLRRIEAPIKEEANQPSQPMPLTRHG